MSEAVAGGDEADSVDSDELRPVAGGANVDSTLSEAVAGGDDTGSVLSAELRALAAGADRGGFSVLVPVVSSARADDVSRAFVDVCLSPLRNRRHVSELCSGAAAVLVTAGFVPS